MTVPAHTTSDRLRQALAQANWDQALALLPQLDPPEASAILMDLPFEQQQDLFRRLPTAFAAKLVGEFPYYHAYVLLHSRPSQK